MSSVVVAKARRVLMLVVVADLLDPDSSGSIRATLERKASALSINCSLREHDYSRLYC
jgi:hypothetical protein